MNILKLKESLLKDLRRFENLLDYAINHNCNNLEMQVRNDISTVKAELLKLA